MSDKVFREIFIFVAGATPQIITEVIYALSQKNPPVLPDEIYIITTLTGKKSIKDTLIKKAILKRLCEEYELPEITLKEDSIIVVRDSEGSELYDIRDESDNKAVGNLIMDFIRQKSRDSGVRLHCSLAGGRKTMGFYLGTALQLFGRPWDRLYHVLVTPEFESNPEFFYKPKRDYRITCRLPDGTTRELSTADAKIVLAELPFIRLSHRIKLHGASFEELVKEGQEEIDTAMLQPEIIVNLAERTLMVGEDIIEMVPMHLMVYVYLLRQKIECCRHPERLYCLDCTDCFPVLVDLSSRPALEKMTRDYTRIYNGQPYKAEELLSKWPEGIRTEQIRQYITKINNTIKETLDTTLVPYFEIGAVKKYGATRYGIRLEKRKIKIE